MRLFAVLAGLAEDDFALGGMDFYAAPLTLQEYAEFLALDQQNEGNALDFLADKLGRRLKNKTKHKAEEITADWLRSNLPAVMRPKLEYLLLHGKMPSEDTGEKKVIP